MLSKLRSTSCLPTISRKTGNIVLEEPCESGTRTWTLKFVFRCVLTDQFRDRRKTLAIKRPNFIFTGDDNMPDGVASRHLGDAERVGAVVREPQQVSSDSKDAEDVVSISGGQESEKVGLAHERVDSIQYAWR